MLKRSTKKISFLAAAFISPLVAWAAGTPATPSPATANTGIPTAGIVSVQGALNYICLAFDYAFWFLLALAVLFGVVGAFKYLTSAGESEKVKAANNTLLYAAIAVAVALLARGIPLIVASLFQIPTGSLRSC